MKLSYRSAFSILLLICCSLTVNAQTIYVNQVGLDSKGAKTAVVGMDEKITTPIAFKLIDVVSKKSVFEGKLGKPGQVKSWDANKYYYQVDFSSYHLKGKYTININVKGKQIISFPFQIAEDALATLTIPSIIHYYNKQRANTPQELAADKHIILQGSTNTVDLTGGWCDASGDISKYFSHLAYTNFMMPQQIPLVTWSMVGAGEAIPTLLTRMQVKDSLTSEALWGADYLVRSLAKEGYFYMTVFSFFNKDPNARRVVGLNADSKVTNNYQSAFREGGGMAIAALARISRWKKDGDFTAAQYLNTAKKAFAHLLVNNVKYADDGKENIIDDYCALLAATELWMATDETIYRDEARKRATNLEKRMTIKGYFIADDNNRPFYHAADAGLPIIALARYLQKEKDLNLRNHSLVVIKKALDYNLAITATTENPFGYARQSFLLKGEYKEGFFIPHENESGWWWQGENARLGSLATAAIVGGRLVYPANGGLGIKPELAKYASQQLSWILGSNPYEMCFMYQFGKNNVPYMASLFGHGSERGGISNGITGKDGNADGSGIDFKASANGNEWRWTEQWIPHAAYFLQAISAMAEKK